MVEDIKQLLELLTRGDLREHRYPNVQLKASWNQDHGKQLAGRANDLATASSWMVIGVNDDGTLPGRDEAWVSKQEETISQHLNQYLDPGQACSKIQCHQINKSWIVAIGISNPGTVVRWNGKAYKSLGTTAAEMQPEEAMELIIQLPGLQDYSAQPWSGKISLPELQSFFYRLLNPERGTGVPSTTRSVPDALLAEIGLKDRNASRILFGDFACRIIVYDSGDTVVLNTNVSPLATLLTDGFQASLSQVGRRHAIPGLQWPKLALSEAIANAVAHAAYFERGGDLMIEIHPKWMCISNLCIRDAAAFANKWFSRSHMTRNPLLMEAMRLAKYVDELGRGKQLIMREFLCAGRSPPDVSIEAAGQLSRWRLTLPTGEGNEKVIRLHERIRLYYDGDEKKSLLALALCLWRKKPLAAIKKCLDTETEKMLAVILEDYSGPIFHNDHTDSLSLTRWARLIIEEGLDSKQLSAGEEDRIYKFARLMQTKYNAGVITPKRLRQLAQMGETPSEKKLSSTILRRWEQEGKVSRQAIGRYKFLPESVSDGGGLF